MHRKAVLPKFLNCAYDMILLFQTEQEQQKRMLSLTLSHLESIRECPQDLED